MGAGRLFSTTSSCRLMSTASSLIAEMAYVVEFTLEYFSTPQIILESISSLFSFRSMLIRYLY